MIWGSGWCGVTRLDWAGCCVEFSQGSEGGSKGSSNGESDSGVESASELSEEGVDVPVDEGVIVAARSWGTNRPLTCGWSFQDVLGARLLMGIKDKVV